MMAEASEEPLAFVLQYQIYLVRVEPHQATTVSTISDNAKS